MSTQPLKGTADYFTNTTDVNRLRFIIEQTVREMVNTSAIVQVNGVTGGGHTQGPGTVSATPMVCNTDADGNALSMPPIPKMPFFRIQGGKAALIIDPVAGDKGVAVFCKQDSSKVNKDTAQPQVPGSMRAYDMADGMLVATTANQAPTVWIEIKQDETITIHAPKTITIETDEKLVIDSPLIEINGQIVQTNTRAAGTSTLQGGFVNTGGTVVSNGVVLETHTHDGGSQPD